MANVPFKRGTLVTVLYGRERLLAFVEGSQPDPQRPGKVLYDIQPAGVAGSKPHRRHVTKLSWLSQRSATQAMLEPTEPAVACAHPERYSAWVLPGGPC